MKKLNSKITNSDFYLLEQGDEQNTEPRDGIPVFTPAEIVLIKKHKPDNAFIVMLFDLKIRAGVELTNMHFGKDNAITPITPPDCLKKAKRPLPEYVKNTLADIRKTLNGAK